MASDNRSTTSPAAFSATDIRRRMAQRDAEKAAAEIARMHAEEEKKKALLEEFHKPPARTAEQLQALVMLAYEAWRDHLRPLGFGLQARVLDYPGGMPGDIGLFLTW
jgi:hypothetical protein